MLELLVGVDPENIRVLFLLATVHRSRGELEEAASLLQAASELDQQDISVRLLLAHVLEDTKRWPYSRECSPGHSLFDIRFDPGP